MGAPMLPSHGATRPGGQGADEHGCFADGGYSWCEATNQCQRPWEADCPSSDDGNGVAIPRDCTSWNDGCNTCMVRDGQIGGCTEMFCARQGNPFCTAYAD